MKPRQTSGLLDHELINRVAQGDRRAFEEIYDRHSAPAYGLALRITGRSGAAEEVTQDAFMSLWRAASGFDPGRATLRTWLLCMVRNRGIDLVRRAGRHERNLPIDDAIASRLEASEHTEEQFAVRESAREARELLADLPREQREVIELAFFAGLSQAQIAARVGVPLGTIKGRQRLALGKMHRAVTGITAPVLAGGAGPRSAF